MLHVLWLFYEVFDPRGHFFFMQHPLFRFTCQLWIFYALHILAISCFLHILFPNLLIVFITHYVDSGSILQFMWSKKACSCSTLENFYRQIIFSSLSTSLYIFLINGIWVFPCKKNDCLLYVLHRSFLWFDAL